MFIFVYVSHICESRDEEQNTAVYSPEFSLILHLAMKGLGALAALKVFGHWMDI